LKGVVEKLRFHDGLVRTVGLTVEIKLRFQISPRGVDGAQEKGDSCSRKIEFISSFVTVMPSLSNI